MAILTIRINERLYERRLEKKREYSYYIPYKQKKKPYYKPQPIKLDAIKRNKPRQFRKTKDTRKGQGPKSKVQYYNCNLFGHIAKNCFKKKKDQQPQGQRQMTGVTYDSVLVVTDRLTKYCYFIPYKESSTAEDLVYIFLRTIASQHGLPKEIISDRETLFTSNFWKSLMEQLGVNYKLSIAFYPQTDGQTKKINQILK